MNKKMKLTKSLAIVAIVYCFALMLSAPVSAAPQKKVEYSIWGVAIGGGTFDLTMKDNVVIFRTITPGYNLIELTVDGIMYYGVVECYTDTEFNLNVWRGTMLTRWEMQLYEQTWFTPGDPCVGTLRGITIAHITDVNEAFQNEGTGVQQGSHGTGVMEGVKIHGYEILYPCTFQGFPTTCFTVEGTAIMK